jgi:hypothetical protein
MFLFSVFLCVLCAFVFFLQITQKITKNHPISSHQKSQKTGFVIPKGHFVTPKGGFVMVGREKGKCWFIFASRVLGQ